MEADAGGLFFGVAVGLFCLLYGFQVLNKAQVFNIPVQKIRGLAMGTARIAGRVRPKKILKGPLSKVRCAHYLIKVVVEKKMAEFDARIAEEKEVPFYAEDNTDKVLVDPRGSDIKAPYQVGFTAKEYDDLPPEAKHFVRKDTFSFDAKSVTVKEYALKEGDKVYIFGYAGDNPHVKNTTGKKNVDDILVTASEEGFIISLCPITTGKLLNFQATALIIGGALCILSAIALTLWELGLL